MIRGVLLPIITPFDEKVRIDEQMMRQLVDFHIKASVQGLFVLGSRAKGRP
jgi:dihydrodipicolinate synthase/N-acetylneuraminate lyase